MRDDTPMTETPALRASGTSRRRMLAATGVAAGQAVALPLVTSRRAQAADDRPVNVGIIGVGNRGTTHLKVLLAQPGVRVVAVCDVKPDRVAAAQEKVVQAGQPQPFGTADW